MEWRNEYNEALAVINEALEHYFNEACEQGELLEAMRYSLLAGGKRIRPVLLMKFCEACGGNADFALPAACGVEMLHTYSLIHDDLPCMDDDDLRRGRPTCHKVYGETNAVLAGDALQAAAFGAVLSSDAKPERRCEMARILAEASGERGMCGGQYLDMCNENETFEVQQLYLVHSLKTGALLRAACLMGVICAGGSREQLTAAKEYAENIGIAFQIRDDVLDCISTPEVLGKSVGADEEQGKITFAALLGLDACARLVFEHTEKAKSAIRGVFPDTAFLEELADVLATREK